MELVKTIVLLKSKYLHKATIKLSLGIVIDAELESIFENGGCQSKLINPKTTISYWDYYGYFNNYTLTYYHFTDLNHLTTINYYKLYRVIEFDISIPFKHNILCTDEEFKKMYGKKNISDHGYNGFTIE